jgi:hypothetical protein
MDRTAERDPARRGPVLFVGKSRKVYPSLRKFGLVFIADAYALRRNFKGVVFSFFGERLAEGVFPDLNIHYLSRVCVERVGETVGLRRVTFSVRRPVAGKQPYQR